MSLLRRRRPQPPRPASLSLSQLSLTRASLGEVDALLRDYRRGTLTIDELIERIHGVVVDDSVRYVEWCSAQEPGGGASDPEWTRAMVERNSRFRSGGLDEIGRGLVESGSVPPSWSPPGRGPEASTDA